MRLGDHKNSSSMTNTNREANSNSDDEAADSAVVSLVSSNGCKHAGRRDDSNSGVEGGGGPKEPTDVPIDRGWAWVIVFAGFGMHVLVVGAMKSFGVLFVELRDKYSVSARELGIVQGVVTTLMLGLGLGANVLAIKFTSQKVVFVGGVLTSLGFILSAFIPSFEFLYLTYSLITGLGFALSYSPCVVMVGFHFKKRRSLANGISVSGSGVGSFILPNIMRWMMNEYGLSGCLLLLGGLMLNVCVCAMLLRPVTSYPRHKTADKKYHQCVNERDSDLRQLMEMKAKDQYSGLQNSDSNIKDYTSSEDRNNIEIIQDGKSDLQKTELFSVASNENVTRASLQIILVNEKQQCVTSVCAELKCTHCQTRSPTVARKPKLFNWSLLSNPVFLIYATSCGLANFAFPNIFLMLPAFAESNGQDRDSAALLLSIIGITDLAGRLFFGWFADIKCVPSRTGFVGGLAISAVLNLVAPLMTSFAGMAVYAALYGFFAGSFFALISVMLAEALGIEKLSSSYGLATLAMSVGLLPGPLICGEIQDATSKWDYAFIFCGILSLLGSIPPLFEPCAKRYMDAKVKITHEKVKAIQDV